MWFLIIRNFQHSDKIFWESAFLHINPASHHLPLQNPCQATDRPRRLSQLIHHHRVASNAQTLVKRLRNRIARRHQNMARRKGDKIECLAMHRLRLVGGERHLEAAPLQRLYPAMDKAGRPGDG